MHILCEIDNVLGATLKEMHILFERFTTFLWATLMEICILFERFTTFLGATLKEMCILFERFTAFLGANLEATAQLYLANHWSNISSLDRWSTTPHVFLCPKNGISLGEHDFWTLCNFGTTFFSMYFGGMHHHSLLHPSRCDQIDWLINKHEYSSVPNNRVYTIIYFRIFSNIFVKLEVIFYIIPKKSYLCNNLHVYSDLTVIRNCRVDAFKASFPNPGF